MSADAVRDIKFRGCGAALIACEQTALLDTIAQIEEDFSLPRGVESHKGDRINASAYHSGNITPKSIDEHIEYAKNGRVPRDADLLPLHFQDLSRLWIQR